METWKVSKNGNPSARMGTISTNLAIVPRWDRLATRFGIFLITTIAMVNATNDFEIFYELFRHLPQPASRTYYESSLPK